jgi:hypothetical protein
MFARHVDTSLMRYCDGDLPAAEARRVDAHLASCAECRAALDEIRFSARLVRQLSTISAPPSVWNAISGEQIERRGRFPNALDLRWAAAACVLAMALSGGAYWLTRDVSQAPWEVTHAADNTAHRMAAGELVETGGSRARIMVGGLGTVDVAPGTRVRLGEVRGSEYRMALERGTISAEITAPPRFFIVDTPASAVVDLGCAYTVTVGSDGAAELRMTSGWAALEFKGRESLVPAGAICRTRPGAGPGTPYFEDASAALKSAVDEFDNDRARAAALDAIMRESRVRDTLTLWHLLARVDATDRVRLYDRIAGFAPPPPRVSREQILALDADALRRWREELAWKW